jgi:cell division septum initiation protein DivIVA
LEQSQEYGAQGPGEQGVIMEILQLVDQLEDLIHESRRIPGTSTLLVNEEECLRIIDQLRVWLPDEMKQAQRIKQERDRIMDEADREARRIVAQARAHSGAGGSPAVVRSAEEQSKALLAQADRDAKVLRQGADQYARDSLLGLQRQLEALLGQVKRGIAHLGSAAGGATPE